MTVLATAAFAFSLFSVAAVASGDSRSSGGRNGFGGHSDRYGLALHDAMPWITEGISRRHSDRYGSALHDRVNRHCYTPEEISKYPPWPPFCS
jgi:hypothetical protein